MASPVSTMSCVGATRARDRNNICDLHSFNDGQDSSYYFYILIESDNLHSLGESTCPVDDGGIGEITDTGVEERQHSNEPFSLNARQNRKN